MKNFVEELRWRGMIHDVMPGTEEQLTKEMTAGYVGFDPTASSLHIGNLATIMLLKHLQLAGHKPIALVGGATGMIGDPSGRSAEREFLSEEVLRHNQDGIRQQLTKFLDFNSGANSAELVNNYDWFKDFSFLDFLREAGTHLTVNYMIAKDSVKKRLETGLSFTEFSYQLLQGYDFYHLYKHKNVRLQMGGSDQWGNITSGTELIRRKNSGEAYALTTPLITKSDGSKFGKSAGGNVWLDANMTSPYEFYQFWLKVADEEAHRLLRVFTLLSKEEIEEIERIHAEAPHQRAMQKALAKDVTIRVHSAEDYETAVQASEILFGKGTLDTLKSINETTFLAIFDGVPQTDISREEWENTKDVVELLSTVTQAQIYASKGEARRAITAGAVSINKTKITTPEQVLDFELLQNRYLLVQKGRKNHLIRVNN
jgi:tyrosyl-tRNA synthetase